MKVIDASDLEFEPASHEDSKDPGVLKKVLATRSDLFCGQVQMVNYSRLPVGKRFQRHYHEDMQEVFVIIKGAALMTVDGHSATVGPQDAVLVDPREVHEMSNIGSEDVEYVVFGVSTGQNGKTIVVE